MCDYLSTYLRRQASVDNLRYTLSSGSQTILAPDPNRYKVVLRGDGTSTMYIYLGRSNGLPSEYLINQYSPNLIIDEGNNPYGVIGTFGAGVATGTGTLVVTTYSYTQYARQVIDAHVRQRISQLGPL